MPPLSRRHFHGEIRNLLSESEKEEEEMDHLFPGGVGNYPALITLTCYILVATLSKVLLHGLYPASLTLLLTNLRALITVVKSSPNHSSSRNFHIGTRANEEYSPSL